MYLHRSIVAAMIVSACWVAGCTKRVAVAHPAAPAVQPVQSAAVTQPSRQQPARKIAETPKPAPSRYPDSATLQKIDELLSRIQDAYFDYDKHNIRSDAQSTLTADAATLSTIIRQYPDFKLQVEGYSDERGSSEYNMALGDARAQKTKEYLVDLGLPAAQMNVVSFGKEKQVCADHNEDCWQKNRRAHVTTADSRGR